MGQRGETQPGFVATRRLIWLYVILWLTEGALRKWVAPQYSMELLLVRDPLVLVIYCFAVRARVFPPNGWVRFLGALTGLIAIQTLIHVVTGDVSLPVGLFGLRTFVLHFPLIWVLPAVFGRKELLVLGRWVFCLAPPLALLMVVQFQVGPDHWLNAATIKGGTQIGSVAGRIRPPAIFSFVNGAISYFTFCFALSIGGFLVKGIFRRWLAIAGLVSALIAMSVAASRGFVMGCGIVATAGALAAFRSGRAMGAAVSFGIIFVGAFIVASRFETIKAGVSAFDERWASDDEMGATGGRLIAHRYGNSFMSAFEWGGRVPIHGIGVGSTSNLAVQRKAFDSPVEGEWERVIYEIGPITGFLFLGFRVALAFRLLSMGFGALRTGNCLCILLAAACCQDVLLGNIRQPGIFGYMSLCAGLCIASFKAFSANQESEIPSPMDVLLIEKPKLRGRGRFAVGGNPIQS